MSIAVGSFDFIRDLVQKHSAIVLGPGKEYLVESRMARLTQELSFGSIDEMIAHLRSTGDKELQRRVVEEMTTNETSFMRDKHPFDMLVETVIPDLLTQRASKKSLRIWSAAASTGQEPYSIAMLLLENFPELRSWDLRITATDISEEVLNQARTGSYSQLEVNRGLPAGLLTKYFARSGIRWSVRPEVKELVDFRQMNLAGSWDNFDKPDVVFMRNVLIYFETNVKKDILERTAQIIARDGYMFLGAAETTIGITSAFNRMNVSQANCYRLS